MSVSGLKQRMKERTREKQIQKMEDQQCEYNKIKKPTNVLFNLILTILSLLSVIPFIFVIIISLTDEESLTMNGYRFIPEEWSLYAYQYIINAGENILRSYGVTILVTVVGTILGLLLTGTYAYSLSRKTYAFRSFFTKVITVPMLFSGGIIPLFMVVSNLHLTNTIWSLVLPGAVPVFNVILLINFFKGVPDSLDEAARIDGASPLQILVKIYLPVSLPALATVALFSIVNHWNDYFSGLIYMSKSAMYPLQTYIQQLTVDITQITDAEQLKQMSSMNNRTFNAAKIVVSTVPLLVIYPFLQKYFVSGMVIGAVKE